MVRSRYCTRAARGKRDMKIKHRYANIIFFAALIGSPGLAQQMTTVAASQGPPSHTSNASAGPTQQAGAAAAAPGLVQQATPAAGAQAPLQQVSTLAAQQSPPPSLPIYSAGSEPDFLPVS